MKNLIRVIMVLIVFILGIILIDKVFVEDKKTDDDSKVKETEKIDFEVSFLIDSFIQEYEVIEFTEEEQQTISQLLSKLNYNAVDIELAFLGNYKVEFNEYELFFDDNNDPYGLLIGKDDKQTIIYIGELKNTLMNYIDQKELKKVYFYYRDNVSETDFKQIAISNEDSDKLLSIVDTIKPLEQDEYVNLMIAGEYYLIVDDVVLYFDDMPGYIMKSYSNSGDIYMAYMSDEFVALMKKYVIMENNECCSCCPDAEPGTVCPSVCCPCN